MVGGRTSQSNTITDSIYNVTYRCLSWQQEQHNCSLRYLHSIVVIISLPVSCYKNSDVRYELYTISARIVVYKSVSSHRKQADTSRTGVCLESRQQEQHSCSKKALHFIVVLRLPVTTQTREIRDLTYQPYG